MSFPLKKTDLRIKMYELRDKMDLAYGKRAASELLENFKKSFTFDKGKIIAGYWPMGSELDTRPLLNYLAEQGYKCCLPCVQTTGLIIFKTWKPGTKMIQGLFGIFEPDTSDEVTPDILIIPLLAFDSEGRRLGYGKGHYDRYLESLRASKKISAVGLAYEEQKIDIVPVKDHDQPLDWMITEKNLYTFHQNAQKATAS